MADTMLRINEKSTAVGAIPLTSCSKRDAATAATAADDLCRLRVLRAAAVETRSLPDPSSLDQRRDALLAYARALARVRFPISSSDDCACIHSFNFTWDDAFGTTRVTMPSLHVERAAVVFNIGAIYSQIALAADLTADAGRMTACSAFESAAGAFAWLNHSGMSANAVAAGAITVDLTPNCALMLEKLMLAQAQECWLMKAIADGKPPKLCSKVARQVGIFYEEVYRYLCSLPLSQHFDRAWVYHVQMKKTQYNAEACYWCSLDNHRAAEFDEEVALLKIGMNALADAKKEAKGFDAPLLNAVTKLESYLGSAVKENTTLGCSFGALPAVCLVRSDSLAEVLDASASNMFSSPVPEATMTQAGTVDLKEGAEAVLMRGDSTCLDAELQRRDFNRANQEVLTEVLLQKDESDDGYSQKQSTPLNGDDYMSRLIQLASSSLPSSILDLPNDLLLVITELIRSPHQIERMRLVSKDWRNTIQSRLGPFLVISHGNPTLDTVCLLECPQAPDGAVSLVPVRSFHAILPPAGTRCWGSAHGLIAMQNRGPYESEIFLYCIHCGQSIPLPPCAPVMTPKGIFFRAAALHDYLVIAFVDGIARPRLHNDAIDWNNVEAGIQWLMCIGYEEMPAAHVGFLPNLLMGVATEGGFMMVDEVGRPGLDVDALIIVEIPPAPAENNLVPWADNHRHIFVCEGKLFLCLLFDRMGGAQEGDSPVRVRFYELVHDEDGYRLVRSEYLGPYSVFLGPNQAIVLPSIEGQIGRRPNTIYLQDWGVTGSRARILAVNLTNESVRIMEYPAGLAAERDLKPAVWTCSPRESDIFDHC